MDETITLINKKVDLFNKAYHASEKLQSHLKDMKKIVLIDLEEAGSFFFRFDKSGLTQATVGKPEEEIDITVTSSLETFHGILTGEVRKMKAIVTKQIKLKAKKIKDLLLLKRLLSAKPADFVDKGEKQGN